MVSYFHMYVRMYVHMHCPESEEAMIDFYYKMKSCHKIYEGVMAYVCMYIRTYVCQTCCNYLAKVIITITITS